MTLDLSPGPYTIRWRLHEADHWQTMTDGKNKNHILKFASERHAEDYIFTSGDWRTNHQTEIERSAE